MLDLALDLAIARPGFTVQRFAFGGVAFEVEADAEANWGLSPEFARHCVAPEGVPVAGRVACAVRLDHRLSGSVAGQLLVEYCGTRARVATENARVELCHRAPGNYLASAQVAPRREDDRPQGPDGVVLGVAAAVLEREGGLCLHAAAVELDGVAVLFLGPSGAGKSTAARLTVGCRAFAFDRVSVIPDGDAGYAVWSLPGGNAVDVARSSERRLPLAGIFRVRQGRPGTDAPRIAKLTVMQALFALRESVWSTDLSRVAEERRVDSVARLRARVPVAEIHSVLGQSHSGLVRHALFGRSAGDAVRIVSSAAEDRAP